MIVYLTLSFYILSVLLTVVLLITGRKKNKAGFLVILILHLTALAACFVRLFLSRESSHPSFLTYSFLAFICTGLIAAGFCMRSDLGRVIKIYFSLFFLSLLFFFYSPSRFTAFLLPGAAAAQPKKFFLRQNYYLEEQRAWVPASGTFTPYKLIQEFGLFHKTLRRNILLNGYPDSVRVLGSGSAVQLDVRVYLHRDSPGIVACDSTDLNLPLAVEYPDAIRRK